MRPLPYIIGTKSYVDSVDAGLGGMGGFEDEPQQEVAAAGGSHAFASHEDDDDSFDQQRSGTHHAARTRSTSSDNQQHQAPPRNPPPPRAQTQYDYDDEDEDVEETFVNDDSTITSHSSVPQPPQRPKPTGNPLKDMLNAQIVNLSGPAPVPASATGGPQNTNQSSWEDSDEDSTAGAPAQKSVSAVMAGKVPPVGAPAARRNSDDHSVASGSHQGRAASQPVEEEEDDEGDLFADNDDPFKLFGSKPSGFNRVSVMLHLMFSSDTLLIVFHFL